MKKNKNINNNNNNNHVLHKFNLPEIDTNIKQINIDITNTGTPRSTAPVSPTSPFSLNISPSSLNAVVSDSGYSDVDDEDNLNDINHRQKHDHEFHDNDNKHSNDNNENTSRCRTESTAL